MANPLSTFAELRRVAKKIDVGKLVKLAHHIDLGRLIESVAEMNPEDLVKLSRMFGKKSRRKELPVANGDFYGVSSVLNEEETALQLRVRRFMNEEVRPIVNDFWLRGEFPFDLIPKMAALGIAGLPYRGYGCPGKSYLLEGLIAEEIARVDV